MTEEGLRLILEYREYMENLSEADREWYAEEDQRVMGPVVDELADL